MTEPRPTHAAASPTPLSAPVPPRIEPTSRILSLTETIRTARRNVLELIPAIAFRQPIVSGRMGQRWHMVQDPDSLRRIFLDNVDNYPKAEIMIRMLRPAVGNSLFTSDGDAWRWQRRTVAPVFTMRNVNRLAPLMTATADRASSRLKRAGHEAEMVGEMLSATFDVICEVALSGREHFDADLYGAAITRYFETAGRASLLDFLQVPDWMPRPGALMGRGAVRTMHTMVAAAIEARRREPRPDKGADDLLDFMLRAEDPETGRRMNSTELLHNMQFFIVAGHETTALALSWSLLLLALYPDVQSRLRDEVRRVTGGKPVGVQDVEATPLVRQVIEEAMRLYPPVGMVARTARHPDVLADRRIRAGDMVFLPIYALHRHELWWNEPDSFDPGNFAPENTESRHKFQYLPFGAGPRVCVGAGFAMMQAHIILATLVSRFDFATGAAPLPKPAMTMTLRPDPGIRLRITPVD